MTTRVLGSLAEAATTELITIAALKRYLSIIFLLSVASKQSVGRGIRYRPVFHGALPLRMDSCNSFTFIGTALILNVATISSRNLRATLSEMVEEATLLSNNT